LIKIKQKFVLLIGLIAAHILATVINFDFFVKGSSAQVPWLNLFVTFLYIGYWIFYLIKGKMPKVGMMASGLLFINSIIGFVVSKLSLDSGAFIVLALLLFPPFAGLQGIVKAPYIFLVVAVISMVMMFISLQQLKQKQ